jgi:serine protease Do
MIASRAVCGIFLLCATLSTGVLSQSAPVPAQAPAATVTPLQKARTATVQISTRAIKDAASARTLGQVRQGSGVVIGQDNLILTIGYLVLETEQIVLRTHDQKSFPARVLALDNATGLALLRPLVPVASIDPVALGQVASADVGATFAVTSADGDQAVQATRLMDVRSFTGYWEYHLEKALYASPPVENHSGAGLFNAQGELVGIGSLLMQDILPESDPRSLAGNLFVPTQLLVQSLEQFRATGSLHQQNRPWLGINAVERNGRIQITRVTPESPAEQGGLNVGAVVISLDGEPLESLAMFYKRVWAKPLEAGVFELTVQERGQTRQLQLPVRDRNQSMRRPTAI